MDEASKLDFLSAFGEEFLWAVSPPVPDDLVVPHDGCEVWVRVFGADPSPAALAALTQPGAERLRAECAEYFECPEVSTAAVQRAVSRTLARWPADAEPGVAPDRRGV